VIVGGISGVGAKQAKTTYLIINYWDKKTKTPFTITILCTQISNRFVKRLYKEKKENE
jgi:hypothetical protein